MGWGFTTYDRGLSSMAFWGGQQWTDFFKKASAEA